MTAVRKRTYTLTAWPWNRIPWVEVPEGLEFTWYELLLTLPHLGTTIENHPGDETRWYNAATALEEELKAAERELRYAHGVRTKTGLMADRRTIRLRRYDFVPGRTSRSQRAFATCEARMRTADAAYHPIREEIEACIAHTRTAQDTPSDATGGPGPQGGTADTP